MKKFYLPVLFLLIFCGCNFYHEIDHKKFEFERIDNDNHVFSFRFYLENFNSPKRLSKLVNELIYNGKNSDEYSEYVEKNFIQDKIWNNYPGITKKRTEYVYHSDFKESYSIVFYNDQFIIFENKTWFYNSTEAHGSRFINYFIIDIPEQKILDQKELIKKVPDNFLFDVITKKHETDNFLRKNIWPPDTINFQNGTVQLIWNTYSILPYSEGLISVELKEDTAGQYLTEKGCELLRVRKL